MAELVIHDVEETVFGRLQLRAKNHGRTIADEARRIIEEALNDRPADAWAGFDAIRERLAASGRTFSDSAELLREDRDR